MLLKKFLLCLFEVILICFFLAAFSDYTKQIGSINRTNLHNNWLGGKRRNDKFAFQNQEIYGDHLA